MLLRVALLALLVPAFGCGGSAQDDEIVPPAPDGGIATRDGGPEACAVEVTEPEAPDLPAPVAWSCPAGWSLDDGACSAWPPGGRAPCPDGEAHFPGTEGCAPIGTACPSGDFSEPPEAYAAWPRIYVNPRAQEGGDGATPERALRSFRDARVAARDSGRETAILLSKGDYPSAQPVGLPKDAIVWGACARDTVIRTSTGTQPQLVVAALEGWSGLGNVSVTGQTFGVYTEGAGIELHLEGVWVHDTIRAGIQAQDGALITGSRVVVQDVVSPAATARSAGLTVLDAALELASVISEGSAAGIAVAASSSPLSTARLEDAALSGNLDAGATVFAGGELTLLRTDVALNTGYGIDVFDGTVTLEDSVVRGTIFKDAESAGQGIVANDSLDREGARSRIALTRTLIADNERSAITLGGSGQTLTATLAILRDTKLHYVNTATVGMHDGLDGAGLGLSLHENAEVWLNQVRIEGHHNAGIEVFGPAAQVRGNDVTISGVGAGLERLDGNGISIESGSSIALTRVLIEEIQGSGIEMDTGAVAVFDDLTMRDSAVVAGHGEGGVGLVADGPRTRAIVHRGQFERGELYGVVSQASAEVELDDVSILDTQPAAGVFGLGLAVNDHASVIGRRLRIDHVHAAGIVGASSARLDLQDLILSRTQPGVSSFGFPVGRGVSLELGATATVTRARLEDNVEVAIFVAGDSRLNLRDAALRHTGPLEGAYGRGIQAQEGARVDVERACVEDSGEVGILASRAQIFGRDIRVLGTRHNACFDDGTCDAPGGIGIFAAIGGRIALSGFLLSDNVETGLTIDGPRAGVQLTGGQIDLVDGTIAHSVLGADVRDPSFDQSRITTTVVYTGNEVDGVASRNTPLPSTDTTGLY